MLEMLRYKSVGDAKVYKMARDAEMLKMLKMLRSRKC